MTQRLPVVIGMQVRLRKPHPCGSDAWTVTRAGADVGLLCAGCGRRVMLEREEFERRVKQVVSGGPFPATEAPATHNGSASDVAPPPDRAGE